MKTFFVFLLLISFCTSFAQPMNPADVKGWDKAVWGMNKAELARAYPTLRSYTREKDWAWTEEESFIDTMQLGTNHFSAAFHIDSTTGGLRGVGLGCLDCPNPDSSLDTIGRFLQLKYGPPTNKQTHTFTNYWKWNLPITTFSINYVDFGKRRTAPGVISIFCIPTADEPK